MLEYSGMYDRHPEVRQLLLSRSWSLPEIEEEIHHLITLKNTIWTQVELLRDVNHHAGMYYRYKALYAEFDTLLAASISIRNSLEEEDRRVYGS